MFLFNVKYLQDKKLGSLKNKDIKAVLQTLEFLIQLSWNEIISSKAKKYHFVPLKSVDQKISNHFQNSEREETFESSSSLMSFAYSSAGRLLGFRKNKTFYITHIDVNHDYC